MTNFENKSELAINSSAVAFWLQINILFRIKIIPKLMPPDMLSVSQICQKRLFCLPSAQALAIGKNVYRKNVHERKNVHSKKRQRGRKFHCVTL